MSCRWKAILQSRSGYTTLIVGIGILVGLVAGISLDSYMRYEAMDVISSWVRLRAKDTFNEEVDTNGRGIDLSCSGAHYHAKSEEIADIVIRWNDIEEDFKGAFSFDIARSLSQNLSFSSTVEIALIKRIDDFSKDYSEKRITNETKYLKRLRHDDVCRQVFGVRG